MVKPKFGVELGGYIEIDPQGISDFGAIVSAESGLDTHYFTDENGSSPGKDNGIASGKVEMRAGWNSGVSMNGKGILGGQTIGEIKIK